MARFAETFCSGFSATSITFWKYLRASSPFPIKSSTSPAAMLAGSESGGDEVRAQHEGAGARGAVCEGAQGEVFGTGSVAHWLGRRTSDGHGRPWGSLRT